MTFLEGVTPMGMQGSGTSSLHSGWHTARQSTHFITLAANLILRPHGPQFSGRMMFLTEKRCGRELRRDMGVGKITCSGGVGIGAEGLGALPLGAGPLLWEPPLQ